MQEGQIKKWFSLVMLAFAVSSVSVILVPFAVGKDGNLNSLGYAAGIMFWAGLLLGIAGYILLNKKANIQGKENTEKEDTEKKKIPDVLRFFSNPPAKVMDGILIIGIIGTIYCGIHAEVNQIIAVVFLLFLVLGIYAHVLLNGKIYRCIWKKAEVINIPDENEGGIEK